MDSLTIVAGPRQGEVFEIVDDEIGIGRAPDNLVALDDPAVSGHHCGIVRDGRKFTVKDLGSTNGTRLNGLPIVESPLKPGDLVKVGDAEFRFDGENVEISNAPTLESPTSSNSTGVTATVRAPTTEPATVSPAFGKRRDSRIGWYFVLAVVGILAIAALAWFLTTLFKS